MKHTWEILTETALVSTEFDTLLGYLHCKTGEKSFTVEVRKIFHSKSRSGFVLDIYEERNGDKTWIKRDESIHSSSTLNGLQVRIESIADRVCEHYLYGNSKEDVIDELEADLSEYLHDLVSCDHITRREMSSILWNFRRWAKNAEYGEEYTYDGNTYALMIPRSNDDDEEESA